MIVRMHADASHFAAGHDRASLRSQRRVVYLEDQVVSGNSKAEEVQLVRYGRRPEDALRTTVKGGSSAFIDKLPAGKPLAHSASCVDGSAGNVGGTRHGDDAGREISSEVQGIVGTAGGEIVERAAAECPGRSADWSDSIALPVHREGRIGDRCGRAYGSNHRQLRVGSWRDSDR